MTPPIEWSVSKVENTTCGHVGDKCEPMHFQCCSGYFCGKNGEDNYHCNYLIDTHQEPSISSRAECVSEEGAACDPDYPTFSCCPESGLQCLVGANKTLGYTYCLKPNIPPTLLHINQEPEITSHAECVSQEGAQCLPDWQDCCPGTSLQCKPNKNISMTCQKSGI